MAYPFLFPRCCMAVGLLTDEVSDYSCRDDFSRATQTAFMKSRKFTLEQTTLSASPKSRWFPYLGCISHSMADRPLRGVYHQKDILAEKKSRSQCLHFKKQTMSFTNLKVVSVCVLAVRGKYYLSTLCLTF